MMGYATEGTARAALEAAGGPAADMAVGAGGYATEGTLRALIDALGGEGGNGGEGVDSTFALGRKILSVEGDTDLATVADIETYSFIDVRGAGTVIGPRIKLPAAEAYGEGRIIYVIDKLGSVDGDERRGLIRVEAAAGDGIDGSGYYLIAERNGFVALRATNHGEVGNREWQIVAVNSPAHHVMGGFANWTTTGTMVPGVGHVKRWSGAHVYVPLMIEVYSSYVGSKFVIRYYPTEAQATADKDRPLGDPIPDDITVFGEFVVGGDRPARSYGDGRVASSWSDSNEPVNIYFATIMLVEGDATKFAGYSSYKDMVTIPR